MWIVLLVFLGLVALFALVVGGYRGRWAWTGLPETRRPKAENEEVEPRKTLWDWLQLLLIPAALTGVALLFNQWQSSRDEERAQARAAIDRELAADGQREQALQSYVDAMSDLMVAHELRSAPADSELRAVARTRTLATLRRLDGERKGILVRFLWEGGLIERKDPIVDLAGADLEGAELEGADLYGANLARVRLIDANLSSANLNDTDLSSSVLERACLADARLGGADVSQTWFYGASMPKAYLGDVTGEAPEFGHADLRGAVGDLSKVTRPFFGLAIVDDVTALEGADLRGTVRDDDLDVTKEWPHCFG
jgi:hypothetical protein